MPAPQDGLGAVEAAQGILRIAVTAMSHAVKAVTMLGDRLMIVRTSSSRDVPENLRRKQDDQVLETLHRLQIKPVLFAIEHARSRSDAMKNILPIVESYNRVMLNFGE